MLDVRSRSPITLPPSGAAIAPGIRAPPFGVNFQRMRLALVLFLVATPALAGGPPPESPDAARARVRQERREAEAERSWKALGRRAIPRLVKIACGDDPTAVDLVNKAALTLADLGSDAARAIYAYRGECGRFVDEMRIGELREDLLAEIYCAMAGPYQEPSSTNARELARWATVVMDGTDRDNKIAVAALFETLERSCDPKIYQPMLPVLTNEVGHMTQKSHRNISGTFRLSAREERYQAALAAIGASQGSTKTLVYVYDRGDLLTKVLVISALERGGPSAAEAVPQAIDFLRLTSDAESRLLALRALAAFEVSLTTSNVELVGATLSEFLGKVNPPQQGLGGNGLHDAWPQLGAETAILILEKSRLESGAQRALISSLRAPLERHVREVAARKLLADARTLSPADRRCAEETQGQERKPLPVLPNAFGQEYAPSWTPPESCQIPAR